MIDPQHQQEGLSMAYVKAIASMAGYNTEFSNRYKCDGTFYEIRKIKGQMENSGITLDFELKSATPNNYSIDTKKGLVIYDLDSGNYNALVRRLQTANATLQILILFCMPKDSIDWINVTAESLVLRKCCFWHQLHKEQVTENTDTCRIKIPIAQQFTPDTLNKIFLKMKGEERILC
jgi:hypothetical protein